MTSIESLASTPPTCGLSAFYGIDKTVCILYVPHGCINAYRAADQWKDFFFVEHTTANDDIIVNLDDNTDCYNLKGSRINGNAQKGIIIKNGNKVLVK